MNVKLREKAQPTIEAFRVNDDNLPVIIRRLPNVVKIWPRTTEGMRVEWPYEPSPYGVLFASEGQYVVFSGGDVEVLSAEDFDERYEEVPDGFQWAWDTAPPLDTPQGWVAHGGMPEPKTFGGFVPGVGWSEQNYKWNDKAVLRDEDYPLGERVGG